MIISSLLDRVHGEMAPRREPPPAGWQPVQPVPTAAAPASQPVLQAAWKLYPPIGPSRSSTSPARYRPGQTLLSIVRESTSSSDTPPDVTSAFSKPSVPRTGSRSRLIA